MNISNDPNVWIIYGLVFLLGVLVGLFMTAGGRKKWKTRYQDEVTRRETLERDHAANEREWRERDSLRGAALKDRPVGAKTRAKVDRNDDGIDDRDQAIVTKVDRDRDGIDDRTE